VKLETKLTKANEYLNVLLNTNWVSLKFKLTVTAIVDDEIVINLVKGEIDRCEEAS